MKKVVVVIRGSPLNSTKNGEALRMALGLTLKENQVSVFFLEEGVYTLLPISSQAVGFYDFRQFLDTLKELSVPLIAEKEAVEERSLTGLGAEFKLLPRQEIFNQLAQCWSVIGF